MTIRPVKITFGQLREQGINHIEVYCRDYKCSHSVKMPADRWPDHVRLSDHRGQVCLHGLRQARRGGQVIPWARHARMGTG